MNELEEKFYETGVVPVVVLEDAEDAVPLAQALVEGGLLSAEVTFRTAAAEESIRRMTEAFPQMLVGAGTVLTKEQVDAAAAAGAKFIVSPGFDPEIVDYCLEKEIPVFPGCITPSEVAQAVKRGLKVVKFFPAEPAGGINMIKAMAAPYTNMKFMPTGGINASNLKSYLDFPKIIACGGSWMVKGDLVAAGKFDEIEKLTREAVQSMLGFELAHVGINANSDDEAGNTASAFEKMFGFTSKEGNSSYFAGTGVEVMKTPYKGTNGHIAVSTNYIDRAVSYLEMLGYEFDMSTAKYDAKNNLKAVYFTGEVGGFAVHLVQK